LNSYENIPASNGTATYLLDSPAAKYYQLRLFVKFIPDVCTTKLRLLPEFCTQIARSEVWGQVTAIDLARRLLR